MSSTSLKTLFPGQAAADLEQGHAETLRDRTRRRRKELIKSANIVAAAFSLATGIASGTLAFYWNAPVIGIVICVFALLSAAAWLVASITVKGSSSNAEEIRKLANRLSLIEGKLSERIDGSDAA
ncbi:MAG: hypothetical protein ABW189_05805 [Rickettsiales bacterium]